MNKEKEFMKIAFKHFPEAKAKLKSEGVDVSLDMIPAFMDLSTKVMNEAYELGAQDALSGRRR